MAGGKLDVPEWDTGIECGHDERTPKHVGVDDSETCSLHLSFTPAHSRAPPRGGVLSTPWRGRH